MKQFLKIWNSYTAYDKCMVILSAIISAAAFYVWFVLWAVTY